VLKQCGESLWSIAQEVEAGIGSAARTRAIFSGRPPAKRTGMWRRICWSRRDGDLARLGGKPIKVEHKYGR